VPLTPAAAPAPAQAQPERPAKQVFRLGTAIPLPAGLQGRFEFGSGNIVVVEGQGTLVVHRDGLSLQPGTAGRFSVHRSHTGLVMGRSEEWVKTSWGAVDLVARPDGIDVWVVEGTAAWGIASPPIAGHLVRQQGLRLTGGGHTPPHPLSRSPLAGEQSTAENPALAPQKNEKPGGR
jgi:hypothetical protein